MKLLLCVKCNDVFNLSSKEKACTCGKSKGKYLSDNLHAEYEGPCLPLGFRNSSFEEALRQQPEDGLKGKEFVAFVIQRDCPTMNKKDEHYWNENNPQPKPAPSVTDMFNEIQRLSQLTKVEPFKETKKKVKNKTSTKRKKK